jgi:hypothetical protein
VFHIVRRIEGEEVLGGMESIGANGRVLKLGGRNPKWDGRGSVWDGGRPGITELIRKGVGGSKMGSKRLGGKWWEVLGPIVME